MGRGMVELKRIENKISRQVTFSERRSGLCKKANDISVLCDADVAVIVFSNKGKLFEYSSDSRKFEEQHDVLYKNILIIMLKENLFLDYPKLVSRLQLLQRTMRNYGGEDLDPLSLREVQSVEHHLDNALKRIRTRKNQLMHESILQLQKKRWFRASECEGRRRRLESAYGFVQPYSAMAPRSCEKTMTCGVEAV